jgi:hypothetical protein
MKKIIIVLLLVPALCQAQLSKYIASIAKDSCLPRLNDTAAQLQLRLNAKANIATTLAGYGIADAANANHTHANADITDLAYSKLTGVPSTFTPAAHVHAYNTLTGIPSTFTPATHTHVKTDVTDFAHTHANADITDLAYSKLTGVPSTFTPAAHVHAYNTLTGIPSTFTPATHTHVKTDVTDFAHTHANADITDLAYSKLTGVPSTFTPAAHVHAYNTLTGIPSTFTPATHTHVKTDVTDFAHTHANADITDLAYSKLTGVPSTFTPAAHNQAFSTITATPTTLAGYGITDAAAASALTTKQDDISTINIRKWQGGNTSVATTFASVFGSMPYTAASPTAPVTPTQTNTSVLTRQFRSTLSTGATAGALAYIRSNQAIILRGNATGAGGFEVNIKFALSGLQAGQRVFAGLVDVVANPTNIDPTTTTAPGGIGMAINTNTGNWNLVNNVTGTARSITALGANYPVNTTDLFELILSCSANATGIDFKITNLTSGQIAIGNINSNIPANTTFLSPCVWVTNNATAAAATIDFISCTVKSNY